MVTHRKYDGLDGLPTSPDHATSFHSNEWNAIGAEPLNAQAQRGDLNATPVSDLRHDTLRDGYTSPAGSASVKDRLHSVTDQAHEKLHKFKGNIRPALTEKVDSIRGRVAELRPRVDATIHSAKQSGRNAALQTKAFLRQHPAILPGVTTAIGLIAGMMARRALRRRKPLGVIMVEPKPGATVPLW